MNEERIDRLASIGVLHGRNLRKYRNTCVSIIGYVVSVVLSLYAYFQGMSEGYANKVHLR